MIGRAIAVTAVFAITLALVSLTPRFSIAADGSLDRVKKAGVLVVGCTSTGPPYSFLNTKTGRLEGVLIDITTNLAKRLGVKVKFEETKFPALIPTLQSGRIDVVASAIDITPQRQAVTPFTETIFNAGETIVVHKNNTDIKSLESLKGRIVGVQIGSVFGAFLKERGVNDIRMYTTLPDLLTEVDNGRIDAFLMSKPSIPYIIEANPSKQVKAVEGYTSAMEGAKGLALRKTDDDLREALNAAIRAIKADGELQPILSKWGI